MSEPRPHIRYQNPYGGHPILRRDGRDAHDAVLRFLEECTDWDGRWDRRSISVAPTGGAFLPEEWKAQPVKKLLRERIGKGRVGITHNNLGTLESESQHDWDIPARLHNWAVDLTLAQMKAQRGHPDPVSYSCIAEFRLHAPGRAKVLAGQDARPGPWPTIRSSVHLHLSTGNTSAFFELALPFAEPDGQFVEYISWLRPCLPVRLAKGNFKHYALNKDGTDFRIRRIDRGLLKGI